jgi:hypothetical protein
MRRNKFSHTQVATILKEYPWGNTAEQINNKESDVRFAASCPCYCIRAKGRHGENPNIKN